jgi:uncharacterized protein YodC (DUF2158 family)
MNKVFKKNTFQVGDVVKLPSETKMMTVVSMDNEKVQCVWLNHELSAQYHDFESDVLVSVPVHHDCRPLDRTVMEN